MATETAGVVCEGCGRRRPDGRRRRVAGRRVCQRCYQTSRVFACSGCGQHKRIATAARSPEGDPVRCADCVTVDEDTRRFVAIAWQIQDVEPDLPAEEIVAAVEQAAPSPAERKRLADNLGLWPGSLTSGASTATRVLWRLIVALEQAGAQAVVRPRCADCRKPRQLVAEPAWSHRICAQCVRRRRRQVCDRCGTVAVIARRSDAGEAVCRNCWNADPASWKPCGFCHQPGRINARSDQGEPVCMACYRDLQPKRACSRCGRLGPVNIRHANGGDLCGSCYRRVQPRRRCGGCGRVARINKRSRGDQPDLCAACNWAPVVVCSLCSQQAMGRRAGGVGPPVCLGCLAAGRLERLLAGPDGVVDEVFDGLREVFAAAPQPRSLLGWLQTSPGAVLLGRLASGELALEHAALDRLEQTASVRHLRQLLVACGVLADRDANVALVERAVRRHQDGLADPGMRRVFAGFATWHQLAGLRRRHPDGQTPPLAATNTKAVLSQTVRFLDYCHDRGISLDVLTQSDLDRWLAAGPHARGRIRSFIAWSAQRGLVAGDLEVPSRPGGHYTTAPMDTEQRWQTARRLLDDADLQVGDRAAGLLVLLYAQPVARIARLTREAITDSQDGLAITFGKDDLWVPEPLAELLRQLPSPRQIGPSGTAPGARRWLFPGRQAGQHIHPEQLRRRVAELGITVRPARQAALLQLSREVPAAVLADMLNIHETTATGWAARSGGTWHNYAARRLIDAGVPPTEPDAATEPAASDP